MMNTQENLLMTEGEFFIFAYLMVILFQISKWWRSIRPQSRVSQSQIFENGSSESLDSVNRYGSLYHQFLVNVPNPRTKDKKSVLLILLCYERFVGVEFAFRMQQITIASSIRCKFYHDPFLAATIFAEFRQIAELLYSGSYQWNQDLFSAAEDDRDLGAPVRAC